MLHCGNGADQDCPTWIQNTPTWWPTFGCTLWLVVTSASAWRQLEQVQGWESGHFWFRRADLFLDTHSIRQLEQAEEHLIGEGEPDFDPVQSEHAMDARMLVPELPPGGGGVGTLRGHPHEQLPAGFDWRGEGVLQPPVRGGQLQQQPFYGQYPQQQLFAPPPRGGLAEAAGVPLCQNPFEDLEVELQRGWARMRGFVAQVLLIRGGSGPSACCRRPGPLGVGGQLYRRDALGSMRDPVMRWQGAA